MEHKQVIIERVIIYSFKNINNLSFSLVDGENLHIEGQNGLGKSNILNAIYWCLTGYDLNGCSDNAAFVPFGHEEDGVVDVEVITNVGKFERFTRRDAKGTLTSSLKIDDVQADSLTTGEIEIDKRLGILPFTFTNLTNKNFNLRRFLLNPMYHLTLAPKDIRDVLAKSMSKVVVKNNLSVEFNPLFVDLLKKHDFLFDNIVNFYEPIETLTAKFESDKKHLKTSKENLVIVHDYLTKLKEGVDKRVIEELNFKISEINDSLKVIESNLLVLDNGRQTWNELLEKAQKGKLKVSFQTLTNKGLKKSSFSIEDEGIDLKQCSTSEIVQDGVQLIELWKDSVDCNISLPLFIDRAESMNLEKIRDIEMFNQVLLTKVSTSRKIKINGSEVK